MESTSGNPEPVRPSGSEPSGLSGPEFYDDPVAFETYIGDDRVDGPKAALEEPALLGLIGDVVGLRIADLGCGDAAIAKQLVQAGCASYLGIDGSARMIERASASIDGLECASLRRETIEDLAPDASSFELVISRLAFHYVRDLESPLRRIRQALAPRGRLVFSVEHPMITSHDPRSSTDTPRGTWVVDDYFRTGPRDSDWLGARVRKYHRTIEDYFQLLLSAGYAIDGVREGVPERHRFSTHDEFLRRLRIPLFLVIGGRRG